MSAIPSELKDSCRQCLEALALQYRTKYPGWTEEQRRQYAYEKCRYSNKKPESEMPCYVKTKKNHEDSMLSHLAFIVFLVLLVFYLGYHLFDHVRQRKASSS